MDKQDGQISALRKTKTVIWSFTPAMDDLIRKTYREKQPVGRNHAVEGLAARLGYPRWSVSKRAREIGAYEPRIKEAPWSESELHILELNALLSCEVIQRKLKARGYKRSITGINLKRKRMNFRAQQIPCSSRAVAECFGIDSHAVSRWIEKGLLKATKKGTGRTQKQGGDEWHIKEKDIKEFIVNNVGLIDIRKVDKFWFVEVLTGEQTL